MRRTTPTRERLLACAHEITGREGYAGASVVAIARAAGVAPSALYRHFPSKGELFCELFRAVCDGEVEAMRAAATAEEDPVERIVATLSTFAARALANPRLAWALIAEPVDPLVDAERLAYRRRYAEQLAVLIDAAIAAGAIPAQPAALTAAALVGGVGEALVGPLSPVAPAAAGTDDVLPSLSTFTRRAIGAPA